MGFYVNSYTFCLCISIYIAVVTGRQLNVFKLDESWICNIKTSCVDCLRLPQCIWCRETNKCFSEKLAHYDNYCKEDRVSHVNYEMSLDENAKCACDPDHFVSEANCRPPDVTNDVCSGRGTCQCGRCFCYNTPDPTYPSKTIMGEYCEYDNFSCNGTKCNEGPYHLYELQNNEENIKE